MASGAKKYVSSWVKNPLENAATGGMVAAYKGVGGATGANLPTSSSLGLPELFPGAQKVKGFETPQTLEEANAQAIARQAAIASGQNPGYAQMAFQANLDQANQQGLAMAASQRGASNPALAFRQAQLSNQQNAITGAQQAAILGQQEREGADQYIGNQYASSQGRNLQQAFGNQAAQSAQRSQNLQLLGGLGGAAMGVASGGASTAAAGGLDAAGGRTAASQSYLAGNTGGYSQGGKIPGKAPVNGDSPENDIVSAKVSPEEIIVPISASKDEASLIAFVKSLKLDKGNKKSSEIGKVMAEIAKLTEQVNKMSK